MKKKITVIIICIFLVGICLYLFFPRTLKGKIKTNNGMSIVKNTPLLIVNDELATTDIKRKKASIEADDKELREVIDILSSVKYYKGFNIIDGKSITSLDCPIFTTALAISFFIAISDSCILLYS